MKNITSRNQYTLDQIALVLVATSFLLSACQNQEPVVNGESTIQSVTEKAVVVVAHAEDLDQTFELVFSSDLSEMGYEERLEFAQGVGEQNNVDALIVGTPTEMPSTGDYWFENKENMKLGWVLGVKFVE